MQSNIELEEMKRKFAKAEMKLVDMKMKVDEDTKDLEIKQDQLRQLGNELNQRRADLIKSLKTQQQIEDEKEKLNIEKKLLETNSDYLKGEVEKLNKVIIELKSDNEKCKKNVENNIEPNKDLKNKDELLKFYKKKSYKYDEIIKLQEQNIKVI